MSTKATTTKVSYQVDVSPAKGEKTFVLRRITDTEVRDGRGVDRSRSSLKKETLIEGLTPVMLADLVASAAEQLAWTLVDGWDA